MTEQLSNQPEDKLEAQFKDVHKIDSYGGTARYVELRPEFTSGDLPVLVAGGWSEGRKALKDTGRELVKNGYRTILVDHARHGKPVVESWEEFGEEVHHKANTLLEVINATETERADVVAHSEGSLNAVLAALQDPDRFRSLVLVAPAGMIGDDSVLKLAGRFIPKVARSVTKDALDNPRASAALNIGGQAYIAKNFTKAYREIDSIANITIDDALEHLRGQGVRIGILQSNADPVFPADRIEQNVALDGPFQNVDSYSSVIESNAGHDDLLIHPERTTKAATQIIEDLAQS